ncbi:MAG: hypothetical protein HQL08_16585, partial [Nitrospirae bacterium]|nr:hypothetical protein [Nitrospirota bacterium]
MYKTQEILTILFTFLAFGFVHSVCVRDYTKGFVARLAGENFVKAFYRFLYTLFSFAVTAAAFAIIVMLPDMPLYRGPLWFR